MTNANSLRPNELTPSGWGGMGVERPPLPPISNKWPPLPPIQIN